MIDNKEVTLHLRRIIGSGENPEADPQFIESLQILERSVDEWKANYVEGELIPEPIRRIELLLAWMNGESVSYKADPWIVVSLVSRNYENNSSGQIDLLSNIHGLTLASNWSGQPGSEPDWLIELDRIFDKHVYTRAMKDFDYSDESIGEFRLKSIVDRAKEIGALVYLID